MEMKLQKVVNSMLAMQRYPWEQGVCAQSLFEAGMDDLWIPMAYDAIKRISPDGRLAMVRGSDKTESYRYKGRTDKTLKYGSL